MERQQFATSWWRWDIKLSTFLLSPHCSTASAICIFFHTMSLSAWEVIASFFAHPLSRHHTQTFSLSKSHICYNSVIILTSNRPTGNDTLLLFPLRWRLRDLTLFLAKMHFFNEWVLRNVTYRTEYKSKKEKIWKEIQHCFLFHHDHQKLFPQQDISISWSSHTPWSRLDIDKGWKTQSIPYWHHCMLLIADHQYFECNWLRCGKIDNVSKDNWSGRWH